MNNFIELKYDWKFKKDVASNCMAEDFDDKQWRVVRVPHDYAIEGPFHEDNDSQFITILADGIKKPIKHTGRTGGLPINDHAWYRRHFNIDKSTKRAFLEFDGVMSNSQVYVNGVLCGGRPYGYSSFCIEITNAMRGGDNLLAVKCAPEPCASRWYPGAGIYRNVRLKQTDEISFEYFSNYITSVINGNNAEITNRIYFRNDANRTIEVACKLIDSDGNIVDEQKSSFSGSCTELTLKVKDFIPWDVCNPYLYTVKNILSADGEVVEEKVINYGIREISFHPKKGFFLNGRYLKMQGVCMHHDLGSLGAAVNYSALERQIDTIVQFGANALRTSHNPPTPELLDLCDKKGILVMDEAFDEWKGGKVDNGYAKYFKEWHKQDLTDLIRRDRNHPCVIMWSTGNEITEQWHPLGGIVASRLAKIVRQEDPTRPITTGFNDPRGAIRNRLTKKIDIIGLNYKARDYDRYHAKARKQMILGSETSSCVSSRGEYYLPAIYEYPVGLKETKHMSSYDMCGPGWAYSPDLEFYYQDKSKYNLGEFVWTGFDYLGEPTPYNDAWPSRSSYFGIVDLAGMAKDRFYSYKSKWTETDTLHIFPHWNWEIGQKVDVHCYSNYSKVELFLNGISQGIAIKGKEVDNHHRLIWKDIVYKPGTIEAVAVDKPSLKAVVKTAGEEFEFRLIAEKNIIKADGEDTVYIRCDVVDKDGIICPRANSIAHIEVTGAGEYLAADNGSQISTRTFSEKHCDAFNGSFMIIARSIINNVGDMMISVKSEKIKGGDITIKVH